MSNSENSLLIRRHIALEEVLQLATPDELLAITEILLDKSNDRWLGDGSTRQRLARSHALGDLYKTVREIAFEIRALGSVSLASLLRRGEPVSYEEVVRDVAGELKVEFSKTDTASEIEEKVLEMLVVKLAKQAECENQTATASSSARTSLNSSLASLLGPLSKLEVGAARTTMVGGASGSVAAVGLLTALPMTAVGAVTAGILAARKKVRPELSGLTIIVVHIARIRISVVDADHEDFVGRLRACL